MNLSLILTILVIVAIIVIIFKIIKGILKATIIVVALIFLISLFTGAMVYVDAKHLRTSLEYDNITYVLIDGEKIISAFNAVGTNFSNPIPATIESIADLPKKTRAFLVNEDAFKNISVVEDNQSKTSEQIISEIESSDSEEEKTNLFSSLFEEKINSEGKSSLIKSIKEGAIDPITRTPFFKAINYVPLKIIDFIFR
ncbi:MAG: hypothetical protein PHU51_03865 [Candidatus Nanoarchaeia archaeon]|nr:hypothetical protein [Candidatus Nanoarchaeia archaeon]